MRIAGALIAAAVLAVTLHVAARGTGPVPPLGPLLDPANGVWSAARSAMGPRSNQAILPGLSDSVRVLYDDRAVPHIFASSARDAYYALGYVVARDRLFQLDLQWRAGAGRLTELVGERGLPVDRMARSIGLPASAERKLAELDSTSLGWQAIQAYAAGVNAYMDAMPASDLPMEYRLLGTRPARWQPINSIHMMNRMGMTLSFRPTQFLRLRAAAMVGWEATDALFPHHSPIQEPIQPNEVDGPRMDLRPVPPPAVGAADARETLRLVDAMLSEIATVAATGVEPGTLGSNSWAVSPSRASGGHALLAGDPHLELSLPSIWYEVHLVVPGELDVYGVTFAGAPWVIIGFNRDIAWTFTNNDADVVDYYAESVDDARAPASYLLDGEWLPLEQREEVYLAPNGRALATDTVRYTHRGPMRRTGEQWLSLRWTVHEPWTDDRFFADVGQARSVEEFLDASAGWVAPSQNMLAADRGGSIAVRSTGFFPLRPNGARGDLIQDGRTRAEDWSGFLPLSSYPFARDPAQGYLATANQQPVDPAVRDGYFGSVWPSPWRAMRINELLRADSAVSPDAMRRYQTDPGSARADMFVPAFLAAAAAAVRNGDDSVRSAAEFLAAWDRRYTRENERAVLFEAAMDELSRRTWDELIAPGGGAPVANPGDVLLAVLLHQPDNAWWNDRRTVRRETRDDILVASLKAALDSTVARHGSVADGGWRWDRVRHATIMHPLQIGELSAMRVPLQGGPGLLNPSSGDGRHGASWRMVVELGDELRAWGTYPGGQSGNPVSPLYRDRIAQWSAGELDALLVPRTPDELPADRVSARVQLTGRAR